MRLTHGFVPTTFGTVAPHRAAFDAPVRVNHIRGHHTHTPRTHWGRRPPPGRTHMGLTPPTGMHHHQRGQHPHSHTWGIATTYAACGFAFSCRLSCVHTHVAHTILICSWCTPSSACESILLISVLTPLCTSLSTLHQVIMAEIIGNWTMFNFNSRHFTFDQPTHYHTPYAPRPTSAFTIRAGGPSTGLHTTGDHDLVC